MSNNFRGSRNEAGINSELPEWTTVTKEDILHPKNDGEDDTRDYKVYIAEKTLAERAVWEFADKHPHVEVTSSELYSAHCTET